MLAKFSVPHMISHCVGLKSNEKAVGYQQHVHITYLYLTDIFPFWPLLWFTGVAAESSTNPFPILAACHIFSGTMKIWSYEESFHALLHHYVLSMWFIQLQGLTLNLEVNQGQQQLFILCWASLIRKLISFCFALQLPKPGFLISSYLWL